MAMKIAVSHPHVKAKPQIFVMSTVAIICAKKSAAIFTLSFVCTFLRLFSSRISKYLRRVFYSAEKLSVVSMKERAVDR